MRCLHPNVGVFLRGTVVCVMAPMLLSQTSFQREIAPVLSQKCLTCHGPAQQLAGLNLSTADFIRKGGQNGPALVPGKSEESRLYRRITGREQPAMPLGGKLV